MKLQVKRAFKSYFFCNQKSNKKAGQLCMKFSSASNISVQRCLYLLFQIQCPIFCCPLFSKNYLNPQARINKMIKKYSVDYHRSPSQLTSRIHPLIFLRTPRGLSLQIFLEFFPKPGYSTMVAEKFQIYGVKVTGKYICESKNLTCSFLLMPPSKTLPQVFIINPRQKEITNSSRNDFSEDLFFLSREEGEEDYGVEKITKSESLLVTSFDKFHHLCSLYIFGFCLVVS